MKTILISVIAIVLVFIGTRGLNAYLEKHKPEAAKKERIERVPVVKVLRVERKNLELPLNSEGVVMTRQETQLSAELAGRIVEVHPRFEAGATFEKGTVMAKIDQLDYVTALAQAEAALTEAEVALTQEEARGVQAARDWERIGQGKKASDMVLRLPFLKSAKAQVGAAEAVFNKAREDLERTMIRAPFNCRVREVNINLGARVAPGSQLGVFYDAEKLMVRLPFSLDDYARIPTSPDEVKITLSSEIAGTSYEWEGEVMWDLGEVDQGTASTILLVKILPNKDQDERFLLPFPGQFLKARLFGPQLSGVIAVPRAALRGGDRVGVLNDDERLEQRTLKIAQSDANFVYASEGVEDGERLVLTKLELAVEGMRLAEAESEQNEEQ